MYNVGDRIILSTDNGEYKEYAIMAVVENLPLYIYSGKFIGGATNIYIPTEEYRKYTDSMSIMTALFNVEDEYIPSIENYIQNKINEIPTLDYRSKAIYEQEYNEMVNTYTTIGLPITYLGVNSFAGQMSFFSYHFTILPIIICIPILIVIAVLIPVLGFISIKNKSVVERLREVE
ncbi:hypothetical protein [Proteiniborus sp.]|uniref:hypothetical protein n=1 Tax=Proteiniborus sp. TaxID=2079015 RepID=UPI0033327F5C